MRLFRALPYFVLEMFRSPARLCTSLVWGRCDVSFSVDLDFAAFQLVRPAGFGGVDWHRAAGVGAGSPPKCCRRVRFLRAVAVLVALILRAGVGARQRAAFADAVRRAAIFLRGARPVAAIRTRLSGLLPAAIASARPQHRLLNAGPDAGARADLQ